MKLFKKIIAELLVITTFPELIFRISKEDTKYSRYANWVFDTAERLYK